MKKLETATPKVEKVEKEKKESIETTEEVVVIEKHDVRCRNCNLLLARLVSENWAIEIKCRRCGYLGTYNSEKILVRENST